ncbi:hypothetical protein FO519_006468, partial [Halicephalobus sp. NKZ332]
ILSPLHSFFGMWMMFDTLTFIDEITLHLVWHMLLLIPFMGFEFLIASHIVPVKIVASPLLTEKLLPKFLAFNTFMQMTYCWVLCIFAVIIIIRVKKSSAEDEELKPFIMPAITDLYKKLKEGMKIIGKELNIKEEPKHKSSEFQFYLLFISVAVLDYIKIKYINPHESEFREISLLRFLHSQAMSIVSVKSTTKVIAATFYSDFKYSLRSMIFFNIFTILAIVGMGWCFNTNHPQGIFNEHLSVKSNLGSGLLFCMGKIMFYCFVLDFVNLGRLQPSEHDTFPLKILCKFFVFALWAINSYLIHFFIAAQNFDEAVSDQIISADIIFSLFLATTYTTKYDNGESMLNTLILIAKKRYATRSSVDIIIPIVSGSVAVGGVIYAIWVHLFSHEIRKFGFSQAGIWVAVIMLLNTFGTNLSPIFTKLRSKFHQE